MTLDKKPERDWHDIAEKLMKATDAAEILVLSQELTQALDEAKLDEAKLDEARKEKPFQQ
jgi:hypothetical protein